jgi:hypothetical protein
VAFLLAMTTWAIINPKRTFYEKRDDAASVAIT